LAVQADADKVGAADLGGIDAGAPVAAFSLRRHRVLALFTTRNALARAMLAWSGDAYPLPVPRAATWLLACAATAALERSGASAVAASNPSTRNGRDVSPRVGAGTISGRVIATIGAALYFGLFLYALAHMGAR